ncbi:hypothetical protein [Flavobacterium piscinae]|uniref:hypothetical protein n=1 Tax=Flavobacterium piscinae TaxID=2506424 RepID=UPI002AAC4228|nr:hypothetical protein [Flavobacterium piscinae]
MLEQHDVPGGWCHSFTLNGRVLAPEYITSDYWQKVNLLINSIKVWELPMT